MSTTLEKWMQQGRLRGAPVKLGFRQEATRLMLLSSPTVTDWIKSTLSTLATDGVIAGSSTPKEQFVVLCRRFIAGEAFVPPLPKEMRPIGHAIWRLKTADLRIVGWFPLRSVFIAAEIDAKSNCSSVRDTAMFNNALALRSQWVADGGSFMKSGKIDDLL